MSLDPQIPQTGVAIYQFIVDRLEDRRCEQYPDGRQVYEEDWTAPMIWRRPSPRPYTPTTSPQPEAFSRNS
jgi:hypothetical protein